MLLYQVQRQRTAGAYIGLKTYNTHEEAVEHLAKIAAEHPEFPYNGENTWQDSNNKHNVNRYRIITIVL